jgi:hypothetical protein
MIVSFAENATSLTLQQNMGFLTTLSLGWYFNYYMCEANIVWFHRFSCFFHWYPQSNEILLKSQYEMLKLSTKCWNSVFNNTLRFECNYSSLTGTSRENTCKLAAAVEVLRKNERQDETQFTTKMDSFMTFISHPIDMRMYFFAGF